VTVRVVGTEFLVEPRGESTWVEVSRGKVEVSWGGDAGDHTAVAAGDSGLYPPVPAAHAPAGAARAVAAPEPADAPAPHGQPPKQVYRARVDGRDYRGAYAILAHNPALAGDTVQELLVAADVSRLSDHPAAAVPYLQRILREHARDERAPMAAFTLGRTLSGLGRTREAMTTFGRVHSDWPRSPLAEDALVRQAEAAAAIGDDAAARALAAQYDRDHPNGRRRAEVRRHAGLE
jgi:TolA-binding protein